MVVVVVVPLDVEVVVLAQARRGAPRAARYCARTSKGMTSSRRSGSEPSGYARLDKHTPTPTPTPTLLTHTRPTT
eukprot:scaffold167232_cov31-Tisochrysis_lutea.AAC.1